MDSDKDKPKSEDSEKEIPEWLKREWEKRGYPPTGPTLRTLNEDFSQLYEELSEYLETPAPEESDDIGDRIVPPTRVHPSWERDPDSIYEAG